MNIIIEGADNSGKSTLAQKLSVELGRAMLHRKHEESAFLVGMEIATDLDPHGEYVIDRTPVVSGVIYDEICGKKLAVKLAPATIHEEFSRNIFIFCCPALETVLGKKKKEMKGVRENHQKIYEAYKQYFEDKKEVYGKNIIVFNYEQDNYEELVTNLKGRLA